MATIASLYINITAATAQFSKGLNAASKLAKHFARGLNGVMDSIFSIKGALIGLAGSAFAQYVKGSFDAINATKDLAGKLGITTDALTQLQFAADMNDSSAEALNNALAKMNATLGGVDDESDKAAKALDSMGLSVEELRNLSPDEAFKSIADGISAIDNPAQRAATAVAIFGKSGQEVINVLASGRAGIEAMAAESDKLGNTLKQIDAEKVDAAGDAFKRVEAVITGVKNAIAVELAPFIEVLSNKFVGAATAGDGMGKKVTAAMQAVANGVAVVGNVIDVFKIGWLGLKVVATGALIFIVEQIDRVGEALTSLVNMIPGVNVQWTGFLKDLDAALTDSLKADGAAISQLWNDVANDKRGKAVRAAFDEIKTAADAAAKAAVEAKPKLTGAFNIPMDKTLSDMDKLVEKLQLEIDTFGMSARAAEIYRAGLKGATDDQIALAKSLSDMLDQLERDAFDPFAHSLEDSLDNFFSEVEQKTMSAKNITATGARQFRFREGVPGNLGSIGDKKADQQLSVAKQSLAVQKETLNVQKQQSAAEFETIDF